MPIHIAITRCVRPGREAEFRQGLREFFQTSFSHGGVWGASMLTPPPGSDSREFGILRTFQNEAERDAFYESPIFKAWDERTRTLTEGPPEYRQLRGLEAWFRDPHNPPPRWKMASASFLGVFPVAIVLNLTVGPLIRSWPHRHEAKDPSGIVAYPTAQAVNTGVSGSAWRRGLICGGIHRTNGNPRKIRYSAQRFKYLKRLRLFTLQ